MEDGGGCGRYLSYLRLTYLTPSYVVHTHDVPAKNHSAAQQVLYSLAPLQCPSKNQQQYHVSPEVSLDSGFFHTSIFGICRET